MNTTQLRKLGVPDSCLTSAIMGIQSAARAGQFKGSEAKRLIKAILETPDAHVGDAHFGPFARALVEERDFLPPAPVEYRTWGTEIDDAAHAQMRQSCQVPVARKAALMPDAHVGYGLPIGGVLAC
jgi:tRNA-splicing ligase RtcB